MYYFKKQVHTSSKQKTFINSPTVETFLLGGDSFSVGKGDYEWGRSLRSGRTGY